MQVVVNGKERDLPALNSAATVADLIGALDLKADRVALEHNGAIVSRDAWSNTAIHSGDKFEVVHFVGGGSR
jgi:thiamine biosynthesis protein ThiS